jgi:hypothetical protein
MEMITAGHSSVPKGKKMPYFSTFHWMGVGIFE